MATVVVSHTADLDRATLARARTLLEDAFGDDMTAADWEHALGGLHALAWDDGALVGHGSVVQRRLLHGGRALRAGYVEGLAVAAGQRGHGHGGALMRALEGIVQGAYELGALGTTDAAVGFYESRGWLRWRGPTSALTPSGVVRTPDEDGAVYVLPTTVELDLDAELTCDWRDGEVW
jgi:aminoglycoside 2'-N-acetyltransferase I